MQRYYRMYMVRSLRTAAADNPCVSGLHDLNPAAPLGYEDISRAARTLADSCHEKLLSVQLEESMYTLYLSATC